MIRHDLDILRWVHTTKGTFTINKAYDIQVRQDQDRKYIIWKKNLEGSMVAQGNPFPLDGLQRAHLDLGSVAEKRISGAFLLLAMPSTTRIHGAYPQHMLIYGEKLKANARSF